MEFRLKRREGYLRRQTILFCEKPLYGSDGYVGLDGDGFAVFARQVGEETIGVDSEIVSDILVGKEDSKRRRKRFKSVRMWAEIV